jgi:uncharacterized protein (DUF2141 family)
MYIIKIKEEVIMAFKTYICMLLIGTLVHGLFGQEQTGTLTIEITGLRNNKGHLMMSICNSKDGFPTKTDKAYTSMDQFEGSLILEDIPCGVYLCGESISR